MSGDYRTYDCPNCGRHRVLASGICEKCEWDTDKGDYAGITGRCVHGPDGEHKAVLGNNIIGPPFYECEYCHLDMPDSEPNVENKG